MTRKADRLFQIIQILRRSSRPVTAARIAEELEVARRTVYRDIADLMGQRVPITGEAGLGYVLDRHYDMPPLMLTVEEVEAVVLGAQMVARSGDIALGNAANDVIAKISAVVPSHLLPFIAEPAVGTKPLDGLDHLAVDTRAIRLAIREGRKLRLRYRSAADEMSERTVWPVILGYSEGRSLLIAWCETKEAFRHFRTDRILGIDVLAEPIGVRKSQLRRQWQEWRDAQTTLRQTQ